MNKVPFNLIRSAFALVVGLIILILLLFGNVDHYYRTDFILSNPVVFAVALAFIAVIILCYRLFLKKSNSINKVSGINFDRAVCVLAVMLFAAQCYVFYNIYFITGWDTIHVREFALNLVSGNREAMLADIEYFSSYPNNFFISFVTALMLKISSALGIFDGEYYMMGGVVINCLLNSISCYLVYKTALLFTRRRYAFIAFCLSVLSVGISPWSVIFYTDSLGLIVPILTFYLYAVPLRKNWLRGVCRLLSAALGVIGYFIKPQCVIVLIAILGVEFISLFKGFKLKKLIRPVCMVLACVLCFGAVSFAIDGLCKKIDFVVDEEKAIGMTHFFMMGLSPQRNGGYNKNDVAFSKSFETVEERSAANIEEALSRIKAMGLGGYIEHIAKKLLTVFNDGTFAWGKEGRFYYEVPEPPNSSVAPRLRSVYYTDGSNYKYFAVFEQIVWAIILLLTLASFLLKSAQRKNTAILWLAIIGLVLFEALFEVRARYVYTLVPVFCLLCSLGLNGIDNFIKEKVIR